MRGAHGAVTNYFPVGVNHRRDLEVNSGFSRVYDNTLHRYLNVLYVPFFGMHRCAHRHLPLSLWLQRCFFFSLFGTFEARKPTIFILSVTWIYVSYALAAK